jgi:2-polyprenyl-3-methyl-5-hydroxy-6-metoxy-1,4-benzoquinol methylase
MTKSVSAEVYSKLNGDFLKEYSSNDSIRRYTKETAGSGISYLLDNDYGDLYFGVIEKYIPKARREKGIRLWEFGCGGGMNLVHLVSALERRGIAVDCAYGTDFSETLIAAANREAAKYLTAEQQKKVRFCVASNEHLTEAISSGSPDGKESLLGSFDILLGVNTIRYCHRLGTEESFAKSISDLLSDGGICIVIDMNQNFPAFRSRVRDAFTKEKEARHLPSLEEHVRPFKSAGFEILKTGTFCWIPHSAGTVLTSVMRALTPILNAVIPSRAMRSLVISRKIAQRRA